MGTETDLDPGGQLIMDPPDLDPVPEHWKQAYVNLKQDVKLFLPRKWSGESTEKIV